MEVQGSVRLNITIIKTPVKSTPADKKIEAAMSRKSPNDVMNTKSAKNILRHASDFAQLTCK